MNYIFYYFAILSVLVKLVNAAPPKNETGTSDGQIVNSLTDQMDKVLKKREYTDVEFLVGKEGKKEIVSAHRAILSSASDVFEAMFRHDKGQIEVPDIEIEAFKAMLRFIYSKHFNGLDANNLLDVLKAADKYNITGLVKECANFPIEKLPNVFVAFEQSLLLNMEVIRWSDEQCRQKGIECSAEKRREMLGPALFNISFPLIPKEDFTKSVVPTDVLTTEEVISIYQHYSHQNLSDVPGFFPLKFPTHRRIKNEDTIEMEIEKVSEFALKKVGSYRLSDAVDIGGMPWKIKATITTKDESNEKWLGFFLCSTKNQKKEKWLGFFLYNDGQEKGIVGPEQRVLQQRRRQSEIGH
ncbi:hypothetical protein niasHS_004471 [Heterodera schachtii]|uniref:BTB domain-containing protein n=1 Tax=Heterodera schachtii TaxID=97005 RepID=A0ABD2JJ74_HETSC